MLAVGRFLIPWVCCLVKLMTFSLRLTLPLLLVLALVVVVTVLASGRKCQLPHSAAAIGTVRALASAQREFRDRCGRYGTFRDLQAGGVVDLSGYLHLVVDSADREAFQSSAYRYTLETDQLDHFAIRAQPLFEKTWRHSTADGRFLYLDETGVIRVNEYDDGPVGSDSSMVLEAFDVSVDR